MLTKERSLRTCSRLFIAVAAVTLAIALSALTPQTALAMSTTNVGGDSTDAAMIKLFNNMEYAIDMTHMDLNSGTIKINDTANFRRVDNVDVTGFGSARADRDGVIIYAGNRSPGGTITVGDGSSTLWSVRYDDAIILKDGTRHDVILECLRAQFVPAPGADGDLWPTSASGVGMYVVGHASDETNSRFCSGAAFVGKTRSGKFESYQRVTYRITVLKNGTDTKLDVPLRVVWTDLDMGDTTVVAQWLNDNTDRYEAVELISGYDEPAYVASGTYLTQSTTSLGHPVFYNRYGYDRTTSDDETWLTGVAVDASAGSVAFAMRGMNYANRVNLAPDASKAPVVPALPDAELQITKTCSPTSAKPGDKVHYTVTVKNAGDGVARDVVIADDTLPSGLTISGGVSVTGIETNASVEELRFSANSELRMVGSVVKVSTANKSSTSSTARGFRVTSDYLSAGKTIKIEFDAVPDETALGKTLKNTAYATLSNPASGKASRVEDDASLRIPIGYVAARKTGTDMALLDT